MPIKIVLLALFFLLSYANENTLIQYNPEFFADLQLCLEGDRSLRKLVDKQHPLSKDYVPPDLVVLRGGSYRVVSDKMMLRKAAAVSLRKMADEAKASGITLTIGSAYRSYETQTGVYLFWKQNKEKGTVDKISARSGYSQHQTGLAVDFVPIDKTFSKTAAGSWVAANASRFGWSLSYPANYESITGYEHESWHYRYVGIELAAFIDKYFGGVQQHALQFLSNFEKED
jgi:D-alanyl-D-alanine carboxypeptidase